MRKDTNNGQERPMTQKEKNRQEQFEKLLQLSARARVIRTKMAQEAKNEYEAIAIEALPLNVIIKNTSTQRKPEQQNSENSKNGRKTATTSSKDPKDTRCGACPCSENRK